MNSEEAIYRNQPFSHVAIAFGGGGALQLVMGWWWQLESLEVLGIGFLSLGLMAGFTLLIAEVMDVEF